MWVRFLPARPVLERLVTGFETDLIVFKIIFLTGKVTQWGMVIAVKPDGWVWFPGPPL